MKMKKISRNDPCWCGSGKKYKKCHMDADLDEGVKNATTVKPSPGVIVKTEKEIEGIMKSCQLARDTLDYITDKIVPGITTNKINELVHDFTVRKNAVPAPLNYNGFTKSVCTSINNVICHGIPDETVLRDGDIINVDVTTILNGYYGDTSRMFFVGKPSDNAERLVRVARECLYLGIEAVRPYADIGEIGYAIEHHAKKNGFSVVRDYGGHGTGLRFHEEPHIHHYGSRKRGIIMFPGMVFTIEPMINEGKYDTRLLSDGWTAVTVDGSLSAQWEHTVAVTETGVDVLTG